MNNTNKDKLISAVYAATLSPESLDDTLDTFDHLVFGKLPSKVGPNLVSFGELSDSHLSKYVTDPAILVHFQLAHDIQLRMGRKEPEKNKIVLLLETTPNPACVFDENESIIAVSACADFSMKAGKTWLVDFCKNVDVLKNIRNFISNSDDANLLVVPGYINAKQDTNTCILIKKLAAGSYDGLQNYDGKFENLFLLTIVDLGFDHSQTELFQSAYGLTLAEVDIAILLASGMQIPEIADARDARVATIRTQIKSIKRKTQSRDVPAIVRLLCGFSAGILISSQITSADRLVEHTLSPLKSLGQITLRDGRKMVYTEQGNPTGTPVLMIHNMPYGVDLPTKAIEAANRLNLRIISPYRPGYGDSDIIEGAHGDKLLDEVATDIYELLNKLGIEKAKIVGQTIGSVYALRFAKLFPTRVAGLFAISRAPTWREEWLAGMPKRQLFSLRITKHVPSLLPYIMRATVMFIDKGHAKKLIHGLCKDSAADLRALENKPAIYDIMAKGTIDGLKQGADAFCRDCHLTIMDFTEEAQSLHHSFHIIHGDADEIVNISQSEEFVRLVPGTELEVVKGAGQLLYYSHWDRVLKAIKNNREQ